MIGNTCLFGILLEKHFNARIDKALFSRITGEYCF